MIIIPLDVVIGEVKKVYDKLLELQQYEEEMLGTMRERNPGDIGNYEYSCSKMLLKVGALHKPTEILGNWHVLFSKEYGKKYLNEKYNKKR